MPSNRRTFLATAGLALAGLAGCADRDPLSGQPTDRSTDRPTATPTATATPDDPPTLGDSVAVGDTTVTVAEFAVVHSFQYLSAPDAFGVESADDGWFAFVGVTADGAEPPAPAAFALSAAGESIAPADDAFGPTNDLAPVGDGPYAADDPSGYLYFPVAAPLDADSAAITLDGGRARWSIPSPTLDPLRSPAPVFTATYDVPDAVGRDEPVPVRIEVTNEGGGVGVCRGAINHTGPMHGGDTFSLPLDLGETAVHETVVDYHVGEEFAVDGLGFEVVLPGESRSFDVRFEGDAPSGTSTGTATS